MKKIASLPSLTILLGLLGYVPEARCEDTLLEINAQNDVTSPGMTVRLRLDDVQAGPKDRFCESADGPMIRKDTHGNFLEFMDSAGRSYVYTDTREPVTYRSLPLSNRPAIERERSVARRILNAFGTISYTKRIANRTLHDALPAAHSALARWDTQRPVKLYTLDTSKRNNAFFAPDSSGGSIHFLPLMNREGHIIGNTADDFDVISHETGHNISRVLRPKHDLSRPQTGALDESIGDIIAITTALTLPAVRERFLKETGGNLRHSSFLSETAESLSYATGLNPHGIRNALNSCSMGSVDCEVHALSCVFTGAVYDVLADAFEAECSPSSWFCSGDEMRWEGRITKVNDDLRTLLLAAHCYVPYENPSFADMGKTMYNITEHSPGYMYLSPFVSAAFENRGIDITASHVGLSSCDKNAIAKYGAFGSSDDHICGTHEALKKGAAAATATARPRILSGGRIVW